MIETFTHATFADRLGESFPVRLDDGTSIETRLAEARTWGEELVRGRGRVPFTLVFRGPRQPVLPQRIYRMEHEGIGEFDLFLVPVGQDAEGVQYEAVFT